jgi:3-phenylpropionate/cinnamic acid dioxygenase small subunit
MATAAIDETAALVRQLADIEAIKQLKARYVRLVDSKQWDEWKTLFTADCVVDTEGGRHEGPDAVAAGVARSIGTNGNTIHRVTMPEITITGPDSAVGTWGQHDVVSVMHKGQEMSFTGYGYYDEEYRRTADGWKILRSSLRRRYTTLQGWKDIG